MATGSSPVSSRSLPAERVAASVATLSSRSALVEISGLQKISTFLENGTLNNRSSSSLALLASLCGSGRKVVASVVVIVVVGRTSSGVNQLLLQTAPHNLRVLAVFVARVDRNLVPVDLQDVVVRKGGCVLGWGFEVFDKGKAGEVSGEYLQTRGSCR